VPADVTETNSLDNSSTDTTGLEYVADVFIQHLIHAAAIVKRSILEAHKEANLVQCHVQ